jgi:hypothetical protein
MAVVHAEDQERRGTLRRLDDILETLEQMNLHDRTEISDNLAERLILLGIERPHSIPVPQLIERVWAMQQPYLITIVVERRRRRRRRVDPSATPADA